MATVVVAIALRRISTMCRRIRTRCRGQQGPWKGVEECGMVRELDWQCWLGWCGYKGLSTFFYICFFLLSWGFGIVMLGSSVLFDMFACDIMCIDISKEAFFADWGCHVAHTVCLHVHTGRDFSSHRGSHSRVMARDRRQPWPCVRWFSRWTRVHSNCDRKNRKWTSI